MLHSTVDFEVKNDFASHFFFSISLSGDGRETQGLAHARPAFKSKLGFLSHLTWSLLPLKRRSHRHDTFFQYLNAASFYLLMY